MSRYLITGATGGIGRAVAKSLENHELLLLGRNAEALNIMCGELIAARPIVVDLAAPASLAAAVESADVLGRLDGLIHVAGISMDVTISNSTVAAWCEQLNVNLIAVAELTRLFLPDLRESKGTVIMVNSGAGKCVRGPGRALYSASKHALVAFADGLRLEEPLIRVVSVFPGRVATEMQRNLRAYEGLPFNPEDYIDPNTLAGVVVAALELADDAAIGEVVISPRSRR